MEEEEGYSVAEPVNPDSENYQEIQDGFVDIDGGFAGSGGGDIAVEQTGEEGTLRVDVSADASEHDLRRDTIDGDATSEVSEQVVGNPGSDGTTGGNEQSEPLDVQISGQPIGVDIESFESYEGVTSEDFASYSEMVEGHFKVIDCMLLVLMVAVFLCAGISAVDTLVRRMERS